MNVNVTSGDMLNDILEKKYPAERFIPFREAMITGEYKSEPFSDDFIEERCKTHNAEKEDYLNKLGVFIELLQQIDDYDSIMLWFGDEPFCIANRTFVINEIGKKGFNGQLILNVVNESTGEIVKNTRIQ